MVYQIPGVPHLPSLACSFIVLACSSRFTWYDDLDNSLVVEAERLRGIGLLQGRLVEEEADLALGQLRVPLQVDFEEALEAQGGADAVCLALVLALDRNDFNVFFRLGGGGR